MVQTAYIQHEDLKYTTEDILLICNRMQQLCLFKFGTIALHDNAHYSRLKAVLPVQFTYTMHTLFIVLSLSQHSTQHSSFPPDLGLRVH
jgi:hypothetical protein